MTSLSRFSPIVLKIISWSAQYNTSHALQQRKTLTSAKRQHNLHFRHSTFREMSCCHWNWREIKLVCTQTTQYCVVVVVEIASYVRERDRWEREVSLFVCVWMIVWMAVSFVCVCVLSLCVKKCRPWTRCNAITSLSLLRELLQFWEQLWRHSAVPCKQT